MREESFWEYSRPFPRDIEVRESTDSPAHFGPYLHAVDYLMPDGSQVLAPRGGIVIQVVDCHNRGGPNQEFEHDLNCITLSHGGFSGGDEFSQLCHIAHRGALVKKGERVEEGQLIARTGSTGWTYEPHLHFMVFVLTDENKYGFQSVKIRFKDKPEAGR